MLVFVLVFFSVLVLAHEFTHIALNGFRVDSFCFFNCLSMDVPGFFGNGYTPFGINLTEPTYPLAKNELLAMTGGTIGAFASVGLMLKGGF